LVAQTVTTRLLEETFAQSRHVARQGRSLQVNPSATPARLSEMLRKNGVAIVVGECVVTMAFGAVPEIGSVAVVVGGISGRMWSAPELRRRVTTAALVAQAHGIEDGHG